MNRLTKTPRVYLVDIVEAIQKIEHYISGVDEAGFSENELLQDAVIRRLEVVGEAVRRLGEGFRVNYPDLPWKKMAGIRDVLIHGYDVVDLGLVWRLVAGKELGDTKVKLEKILKDLVD